MSDLTLPFSEEKQLAFIGHLLTQKRFFDQTVQFVSSDWFINPIASKIHAAIMNFYRTYNRQPSVSEISNGNYFEKDEKEVRERIPEYIKNSSDLTTKIGLDIIKSEIDAWFSLITFKKTVKQAHSEYNSGQIEQAWHTLNSGCIKKTSSSFDSGAAPTFIPAPTRAIEEKFERMEQSKSILSYGVQFLDDSLGGIIPNDLIFLGARSGFGKTGLANNIARHNASKGYPVHYFALEAENGEMERRSKFSILSDLFYKNVPREKWPIPGTINYLDWRLGRLEAVLAPFEAEAVEIIKQDLKTLYTLYRTSGEFGLETLDRHLSTIAKDSSLIVIDHLHYIDIEGENENRAYKDITKKIRDSCLKNGVPVIVIAHLRKEQSGMRQKALVPSMEDFHGSSDLFKIATSCIMLSPAFDEAKTEPYLWPTYMRSVKTRLEMVRTRYTGILDFNAKNNLYEAPYRLGRLVSGDTEWQELEAADLANIHWAKTLGKI